MRRTGLFAALVLLALPILTCRAADDSAYEGQPSIHLSNGALDLVLFRQGATIASVVLADDPAKLNPLWNPLRLAREAGRPAQFNGTFGHFVCVDGFGPVSAEERAAGLPGHGEAHLARFEEAGRTGDSISLKTTLPIVQEVFTRTYRMAAGESVIYVDSKLENLLGFDRPVNWAEHATIAAPFLEAGKTTVDLSGSRSRTRPWDANPAGRGRGAPNPAGRGGGAPNQTGRGGAPRIDRRLTSGQDFAWPMAPAIDGGKIDMRAAPDDPHYLDHTATLLNPSERLEWVAALNVGRRLIYGYVFRREDYPWLQTWGNYPSASQLVRGMEFGTQPFDLPRRETIGAGSMFDTPVYRWLPAKSAIESHFLLFYAHVPEGMRKVDSVRMENGSLVIADSSSGKRITLAASRGL